VGGLNSRIILTSPDGITWTAQVLETKYKALRGVAYGNGLFVAVGGEGIILTSRDGINWSRERSVTGEWPNSITYADGRFIAVGGGGAVLISRDGVGWTQRTTGTGVVFKGILRSVAYGNGIFMAVGENIGEYSGTLYGIVRVSSDGINWTELNPGTRRRLYAVTYGNNRFVAVGEKGTILTSP